MSSRRAKKLLAATITFEWPKKSAWTRSVRDQAGVG